jgi:hypothetical protein
LIEKICALNMGVMEALAGIDYPHTMRIVAEDLKFRINRYLSEVKAEKRLK